MAQASQADDPRERAVSSEPCSTRPNPFDDGDISRKRRRTSAGGTASSRSHSVETVDTIEGVPASVAPAASAGGHELGAILDSEMKIDSESTIPTTPEQRPLDLQVQQPSGPRSSRVTINVRTPSRPLEAIPSSPSSPPSPVIPQRTATAENVKLSVEESEVDMGQEDGAVGTPTSLNSDAGSSPIEYNEDDDEIDFGVEEDHGSILHQIPRSVLLDPSGDFPYRDDNETISEAITRLCPFLTTHETVGQSVAEWLDSYLAFAKTAAPSSLLASYVENRELWQALPEFVFHMVNPNRRPSLPRAAVSQEIFRFYKSFAKLTALFVELEVKTWRDPDSQTRPPESCSAYYVGALGRLTSKDEVQSYMSLRSAYGGMDDDIKTYADEVAEILEVFQTYPASLSGSLGYMKTLAKLWANLVPRYSTVTDHIAGLALLTANVQSQGFRRLQITNQRTSAYVRSNIIHGYGFFETIAPAFEQLLDRHVNHFSCDSARELLSSLAEIYLVSASVDRVVDNEIIREHRLKFPLLPLRLIPDAVSAIWKIKLSTKLIMSSQMQLRVLAATSMCNDLVSLFKRFGEAAADEHEQTFMTCISTVLIDSGLVGYILSAQCHPEVTIESHNIIGFLVVSRTYTREHTDNLWATVMSTQDPRISDALIKMLIRILGLFQPEELMYLCEKLQTVTVESFNSTMREYYDSLLKHLVGKVGVLERPGATSAPFDLCIGLVRLIRQAAASGSQSHSDVLHFATSKFREILNWISAETRQRIYVDCLGSISQNGSSEIGSLWVIFILSRLNTQREIAFLASDHNLTTLLIKEFESAIAAVAKPSTVLSGLENQPRRELLSNMLLFAPETIPKDLGPKFWHLLVGPGAACREDRDVGWKMLNTAKRHPNAVNPFGSLCFSVYLPTLPSDCFCLGTLEFVRDAILPFVNDEAGNILDDEDNGSRSALEQLWRLIISAPEGTIENQTIATLVRDVYLESRAIKVFPHFRARKIHLSLVNRCLQQLSAAATKLKSIGKLNVESEDESMEMVPTEQQIVEQKLLFIRSLAVLREFHMLHRSMSHFSAPDLRPIINKSPKDVDGESAELKYQSFDGNVQTDVLPLNIGKRNTAATLFASLREATGFDNYRAYYRGRPFVPQESEICKSLDDLQIHNGIILVKRETDVPTSPTRARPGASRVEVEILGHFEELWEYLTMEEKLAREIYTFLVELPIDEDTLESIKNPSASYHSIFSVGQPLKTLYAVHALRGYHAAQQAKSATDLQEADADAMDVSSSASTGSLARTMSLVVSAISDPDVISQSASTELQIELGASLVDCLMKLLAVPLPAPTASLLDGSLLDRLLVIMSTSLRADTSDSAAGHVTQCLQSILTSCSMSSSFMSAFCTHAEIPRFFESLLLCDPRATVRVMTADLIRDKIGSGAESGTDPVVASFREYFWPLVTDLVGPAVKRGTHSVELLDLCLNMFKILRAGHSPILNIQKLLIDWSGLLLSYTTTEDLTQPDKFDPVAMGLVQLLHCLMCGENPPTAQDILPLRGLARRIFWKHLFPRTSRGNGPSRPILWTDTRVWLTRIILKLIEDDAEQLRGLFEDLNELVPVYAEDEEEVYSYELPQNFERHKAVKSACGYVGLKNLSNTCYFNSLLTQLFMNTGFRHFMSNATIQDASYSQALLFQTKKLFAFMQSSLRRSMNPEDLILSIKTYDNTQIDIHNQMDVDEFYNLLFDRWEAQLTSAEERRQFRSFYGGQLVQQVASKECPHISERLEPFSAIQCDIKGKKSLEESLQAYVDGEIMNGDNKYKCSTCDRHVDAVKRACLKDIPDNMIFHLKRFDFNLRTLQRSKINDHFAFPATIDMQPYTIEHLSGRAEDRTQDIFELVGVLVHSGNAESGHYYSYIRERPSSSSEPAWVEFNDENVVPFEPANMEGLCFGGPGHVDNNGLYFDKNYSAYMLFYQRSTSLAKEQELLRLSHGTSPLRVRVAHELESVIEHENNQLLRRHCLYDPRHILFVRQALMKMSRANQHMCSKNHRMENLALTTALSHLDQVASRAKDTPDFNRLYNPISDMSKQCTRCSLAVYTYFQQYHEAFRMLVQRNATESVRRGTVILMLQVLSTIKAELPQQYGLPAVDADEESDEDDYPPQMSVMQGTIGIFKTLWDAFHMHIKSWPEVFELMLAFVNLGRDELAAFLGTSFLRQLMLIIYADVGMNEIPQQYVRMSHAVSRRRSLTDYEYIIELLDVLIGAMEFRYTDRGDLYGLDSPSQRRAHHTDLDQPFLFTNRELEILKTDWTIHKANIFLDKLIGINQNPRATRAIVGHLMKCQVMEEKVYMTLTNAISGSDTKHAIPPYLRIAVFFCRQSTRPDLIQSLIHHVNSQCMSLQNGEGKAFFEFQRDVFGPPRQNSGEGLEETLMASYDNLPEWAPGLLGCFDSSISEKVETFVHDKIFKYGPSPVLEDSELGRRRASKLLETARMLGVRCADYLNEQFVNVRGNLSSRMVGPLQRVLRECIRLLQHDGAAQGETVQTFIHYAQDTLEAVQQTVNNNSPDNGSGMFYSDSSSVASSNTAC
ncbi:ubiquitin carboxyl-terminal hydrolase 34 [Rhypophila decipiens]